MSVLAKDALPKKTFYDCLGLFCFLGCLLVTVGLSCFGMACIWKEDLFLEAIDALLSMLKLLAFNCSFLLLLWAALYTCPQDKLGIVMAVQHAVIYIYALIADIVAFEQSTNAQLGLLTLFLVSVLFRPIPTGIASTDLKICVAPFIRRAVSKGVTRPLLISYGLGVLFIAVAALGAFGLLAYPASTFGKIAASIVVCGTILALAVAARLLRVLHASKVAHSRALLGSLESDKVTAFVISYHLGSSFFYYAISCIPVMIAAIICISIEGWRTTVNLASSLATVATMLFPIYDTVCGMRMLIRKKSIWDEWYASFLLYIRIPACSASILLLHCTGFISSFGGLLFAHNFGLKLFGNAQLFNPYSILTCTAICLVNNLLCANMAAETPAQIGIYLNAPHVVNLEEIPESEFANATRLLREPFESNL